MSYFFSLVLMCFAMYGAYSLVKSIGIKISLMKIKKKSERIIRNKTNNYVNMEVDKNANES